MSTKGRGAVLYNFKQSLHLEEVTLADPDPGEILVRMRASGVCHTDLHAVDGDWPIKPQLPFIPGHAGLASRLKLDAMSGMLKKGTVWACLGCARPAVNVNGVLADGKPLCPNTVYGGYTANRSFADYASGAGCLRGAYSRRPIGWKAKGRIVLTM